MNIINPLSSIKIEREVVGKSHPHDSAARHVRGEATYIDDMPDLPGTLHIAPILSLVACGELQKIDTKSAEKCAGVVRILTAKDIPGHNDLAPILSHEPVFVDGKIDYVGQVIGAVVATSLAEALQAADKVGLKINETKPCFDVETAH